MSSLNSRVKSKAILTFSPDVAQDLRHRCRNPRCRGKLQIPTDNVHNAFCTRTCFTGYFRSRCLVCERSFKRMREGQHTCGRSKCQTALRRDWVRFFGKWAPGVGHPSLSEGETLRNPIESGIKSAHESSRPWRQIAGPPASLEALRLATIGVDGVLQLERKQKALVESYLHDPDPDRATQREAAYVVAVKRFRDRGWGKPVAAPALPS
jgi:hypothetical protein